MKIIFLGTNGWYDSKTGNTVCALIETLTEYLILDAGNGLYKIDRYIKRQKPIYIFLSHFHFDHIAGLHVLNKFNFPQGIEVYGPRGLRKCFRTLINKPYSMPIEKLKTRVSLHEINKNTKFPLDMEFKELKHTTICYGYRFYLGNRIISYCTDTGLCKNLFLLAKDADWLISECSYAAGRDNREWPHLTPENAAFVARKAKAKRLFLTHFDASIYQNLTDRKKARITASRDFYFTREARDGMAALLK